MPTIRSTSAARRRSGAAVADDLDLEHAPSGAVAVGLGGAQLRRGALGVLVVGLDDALHEAVAHDVGAAEAHELDAFDPPRISLTTTSPSAGRAGGRSG